MSATPRDHQLAAHIASEAGALLVALREGKLTGGELGAEGDRQAHRLICQQLREAFPQDTIRSEEDPSGHLRAAQGRTWIVDPLDGTREFGEPGRDDWAVHVALAVGEVVVAGAVALPARGRVLCSEPAPALPPEVHRAPRLLVSRSRPPPQARQVAEAIGAELVSMGSAGAKAAAVILGEAEIYLHDGGQYEWDSAAPVAVARAAGLHTSRLDGTQLRYNQPAPYLPDLLICRTRWARPMLEALRNHR